MKIGAREKVQTTAMLFRAAVFAKYSTLGVSVIALYATS
jgi:hypothetical protein